MEPIMENHGTTWGTMVNRGTSKENLEHRETDHGQSWNNCGDQQKIIERVWKSWKIMEQIMENHGTISTETRNH
jgi:hypothetical protein